LDQELAAEAISPELVLVDTALAVRARADLPWRPWEAHPPVEVVPIPGPPAARTRRRRFTSALGVAAVLGLGLLAMSLLPTRDRPSLSSFALEPQAVPSVAPTPPPPQAQVRNARATRRLAPSSKPRAAPAPSRAKPAPKPKAAPTPQPTPTRKPKPQPQPPPKRTYAWKPFSGAVYYQVSFVRNGGAFYATQTRLPRVRLPAGLRFRPGRYRWTVRPAIVADLGIRLADPIIRRAFMVRRD
jgi:hypothetical protein